MKTLFDEEPIGPPGFQYRPQFLTLEEEKELLSVIAALELKPMQFQGYEAKRKTANFGWDWSFEKRVLSKGRPIPSAFTTLIEKASGLIPAKPGEIAELLVTEYPQGSVINWHRDAPPFHTIAGISLLSDCLFKFRPHDKAKQGRRSIFTLPVSRRSMYIISGQSRTDWEHSIAPVQHQRYSITLRTLVDVD